MKFCGKSDSEDNTQALRVARLGFGIQDHRADPKGGIETILGFAPRVPTTLKGRTYDRSRETAVKTTY